MPGPVWAVRRRTLKRSSSAKVMMTSGDSTGAVGLLHWMEGLVLLTLETRNKRLKGANKQARRAHPLNASLGLSLRF
jgi:hypothetical protein